MTKTHGMNRTRPHIIWKHIRGRIYNKKNAAYKNYGGRGITICKRWSKFELFWQDMKDTYEPHLTIDRIDNNKGYSPENCRWADRTIQSRNRRNNIRYRYQGFELTLPEFAKKYKIPYKTLRARIIKLNWPIEKAISIGKSVPKYYYKLNGMYTVEVTKFGGRIFGGRFTSKSKAKEMVKQIINSHEK